MKIKYRQRRMGETVGQGSARIGAHKPQFTKKKKKPRGRKKS